ncbi:MAG TPA: DMT family transporter [Cyclobacteriaceae bacterium]|nr:DMT family transporter [Cyclobacteriaceae bacterium]
MYWSKGIIYMLLSGFFFSLMNICVKLVPGIPSVEIVLFRSLVSLVISFTILKYSNINVWGNNKKYLILRGLFGAGSLILYFELLHRIPFASVVTLFFLAPIFTNIIGIFIVKEKVHPWQWIFYLVSFAGILLVKGFDSRISLTDLFIGIGTSLCSGFALNFVRKLGKDEHPVVIIFYFPLMTIPLTGAFSLITWKVPGPMEFAMLILIGVLTQIAQFYLTKAYQSERISRIANLQYLNIIYALSFGFAFFRETYNYLTLAGIFLAVSGVLLNLMFKKTLYPVTQSS